MTPTTPTLGSSATCWFIDHVTAPPDGELVITARDRDAWRAWLDEHGASERKVWLLVYRSGSPVDSVRFRDAIEDALCFGWVDSKALPRDRHSCYLAFSPRNPKGTWGRMNRLRVDRLTVDSVAASNFAAFPHSSQRLILQWIATAKRTETRQRRILETVELAAVNKRANHR
jgi:uncharacterized protein YdeI (YjbR/CyaY-like superfamily)